MHGIGTQILLSLSCGNDTVCKMRWDMLGGLRNRSVLVWTLEVLIKFSTIGLGVDCVGGDGSQRFSWSCFSVYVD